MHMVLWILASVALLVLAGTVYQHIGSLRDRRMHTGQGRSVSIGRGCGLYFFEEGRGEPTVLFEAGIGATHLNWRGIQDPISTVAHTVAYDRASLGWSSPCRTPRTPGNIATELHRMLEAAGFRPPYVLVGHSFGGLVMRRYALLYPDEVSGVVLVDPMRSEEWPPLNPSRQSQLDLGNRLIRYALPVVRCGLARLLVTCLFGRPGKFSEQVAGVAGSHPRHVLYRIKTEVRKMPRAVWPAVAAHWSRPSFYAGLRSHIHSIPATVREMHTAEPIRGIPVTVLTPRNAAPLTSNQLDHIGDSVLQIIARKSEHWIHLDEPDLVINAIRVMIGAPPVAVAAEAEPAMAFVTENALPEDAPLLAVPRSAR
ncbi:MAG: alpha/beta fold hydrolase [Terracidiphilus sp.]|nr:alpha/beta fold hydrolase [Terracidiphilus sp.]MDR3796638.1 alpha/beta fold hydrolase [Terracidiphilus sp.]